MIKRYLYKQLSYKSKTNVITNSRGLDVDGHVLNINELDDYWKESIYEFDVDGNRLIFDQLPEEPTPMTYERQLLTDLLEAVETDDQDNLNTHAHKVKVYLEAKKENYGRCIAIEGLPEKPKPIIVAVSGDIMKGISVELFASHDAVPEYDSACTVFEAENPLDKKVN